MSDDLTATWTTYDYALMKHLESGVATKEQLAEWVRTCHYIEPPAAAREFGHVVTVNPETRH